MQIWNIRTNKMVYQFAYLGSAVTCLAQSPVVDVVAIGLLDGTTILYNIKADEKIDSVRQDDRVTAITFRTGMPALDDSRLFKQGHVLISFLMIDDEQFMATGNMHGDVALWDLSERRLAHIMKNAHDGYITSLTFLHNQPVLVTGATDNSIKVKKEQAAAYSKSSVFTDTLIAMDFRKAQLCTSSFQISQRTSCTSLKA